MGTDLYVKRFLADKELREPLLRTVVNTLPFPPGSRGLDVGCGIGLQCLLLAEKVGAAGHVTGLDISARFLKLGRERVKKVGLADRISFKEGDVSRLPFDNNTFDWVWSTDCVGYAPWEPLPLLQELARVTKPGGIVAILSWSSEILLPGYPRLEARLRATTAGLAPFIQGKEPEKHFLHGLGWFRELGFQESKAQVFADSVHAPLSEGIYSALESLFDMRWPDAELELSTDDRAEFKRLCSPDSPDFILNIPGYYAHFTYTVFWGNVAPG